MSLPEFLGHLLYSQYVASIPYPDTDDFQGKTIIVTGANTGLGKEAARHFVRLGAEKVIIACRTVSKGEEARTEILSTNPAAAQTAVEVWQLDLGSYASVKAFAARATKELKRLDVLVENAGIATVEFRTAEGEESTVVTNVISTFLLAFLLLPKLKDTAATFKTKPRLTIVSSDVHYQPNLLPERKGPGSLFENLSNPKISDMKVRYPTSKLIEVLLIRHLVQTQAPSSNYPVTINTVTPGFCVSSLGREHAWTMRFLWILFWARTTEVGGRTLVHAANAGDESHGQFLMNNQVYDVSSWARSAEGKETGEKLWNELSVKLEGISPGVMKNI